MPIPGPGTAISMNTIATEFGGTVPHSLSEYYRGGGLVPNSPTNAAIPTSGTISMGNFYGSANRVSIPLVLSTNTYNYDIYTNRGPTYVAGSSDITVTVNPGVTVGSTSTGTYAMLVPSAFNPLDTVTIVNNGVIQGMGGAGGTGGAVISSGPFNNSAQPGSGGAVGGNALYVNRPTVITNNGTVAGGGGGAGGGGACATSTSPKALVTIGGGGGGGGAGFNGGGAGAGGPAGGPAPSSKYPGFAGSAGTSPAGGAGGPRRTVPGTSPSSFSGAGGAGGGRGAAGATGETSGIGLSTAKPGGSGGGAGNYIVGNPFVTWPVTGTRQGGVA